MSINTKTKAAVSVSLSAVLLLAGCGSSSTPEETDDATNESGIELPEEYQGRALVPTIIAGYPPLGFQDESGNLTGFDYDMAVALGEVLGVELEIEENAFENGLLGITAGRFDWTGSAGITEERLETYDMVPYFASTTAIGVLIDSPDIEDDLLALCGVSLGATSGDLVVAAMEAASEECVDEGLEPIDIQTFPRVTEAQLATKAGNVDGWVGGRTLVGYTSIQEPDTWKVTGPGAQLQDATNNGFVTRQGSGLAEVLVEALNVLIEDGTYLEILEEWGLGEDQAVLDPEVHSSLG